ncbi:MAG: protein kinase [Cocleimonas sp.]|nr:protein kinase [Cocleimonas sp.]
MSDISTINIPDHEIKKQLGEGGMANVYLAVHQRLRREVALKVMKPEIAANTAFQKSFMTEGYIVAKLEHPHIMKIHDIDEQNGYFYMSTEVLRKGSLKRRLTDGGLPLSDVLKITLQIADALRYAHEQGYIHRDIKPANIMFRDDDSAVLTDFGIAKMQGTTSEMTQMGYIAGTPFYMSPEQGVGSAKIDRRADIYSLGIVFYEMLTGEKPYTGNTTVAVLYEHAHTPIPALQGENTIFQSVLDKALGKQPEERFNTIKEFISALKQVSNPESSIETIYQPRADLINNKKADNKKIFFAMSLIILATLSILGWVYVDKNKAIIDTKQNLTDSNKKMQDEKKTIKPESNDFQRIAIQHEQLINNWISGDDRNKWTDAISGLKKSAQTGDAGALIWLGYAYEKGRGVDVNWNTAWHYYSDAMKQDNDNKKKIKQQQQALERKANAILQNTNSAQTKRNKAYRLIEAIANNTETKSNAHLWMVYRYSKGDGITSDKTRADWWQKKYDGES